MSIFRSDIQSVLPEDTDIENHRHADRRTAPEDLLKMKPFKISFKKIIMILCGIIFIHFCSFNSDNALASDAEMKNLIISHKNNELNCSLYIGGAFREKTNKAILSGVPVSFSFYVNLHQIRDLWLDKKIAAVKATHTIKYNNLKKEFTVIRSWENNKAHIVHSFEEAQRLMTEIQDLKIIPLAVLSKGTSYKISAMAEMNKIKHPYYMHYFLFFLSLNNFETDWYTINFIY